MTRRYKISKFLFFLAAPRSSGRAIRFNLFAPDLIAVKDKLRPGQKGFPLLSLLHGALLFRLNPNRSARSYQKRSALTFF
jgi:hypothetical protein